MQSKFILYLLLTSYVRGVFAHLLSHGMAMCCLTSTFPGLLEGHHEAKLSATRKKFNFGNTLDFVIKAKIL